MSDINIATYCLKDIGTYPILHIQEVEKTLNKLPKSSKESTFCFSLCTFTSHEEMVMNTLEQLLTSYDIDLMGGTAAADDKGVSYVLLNDVIETDACILTFIQNKSGRVKLYKENIFHPTNTWFIATDVDVDKRLLKTLEYFSNIYKNATLCKMQLGDYKAINEETVSTILKDIPHPSGALAINCILRTIQFENEHFNTDFAANLSKLGTFAGFSSFGEQIHYHHCNQTLVLAVFE